MKLAGTSSDPDLIGSQKALSITVTTMLTVRNRPRNTCLSITRRYFKRVYICTFQCHFKKIGHKSFLRLHPFWLHLVNRLNHNLAKKNFSNLSLESFSRANLKYGFRKGLKSYLQILVTPLKVLLSYFSKLFVMSVYVVFHNFWCSTYQKTTRGCQRGSVYYDLEGLLAGFTQSNDIN